MNSTMNSTTKKVSIIIACRNEEQFLGPCLLSLLEQDYPQELIEIIVVDGLSTDRTWEVANSFRERYPNIDVEVNRYKHKYAGLNQALKKNVTGDYVAVVDAHSLYPENYISGLTKHLDQADNVGGGRLFKPRSQGLLSKAITLALTLPFSIFK